MKSHSRAETVDVEHSDTIRPSCDLRGKVSNREVAFSGGYIAALDGLRALAAITVVGFHVRWDWMLGGFAGVDAFFVLSGFLITSLLRDEIRRSGTISLKAFWIRRAARLWPALAVVCAAVVAAAPLFWPNATLHDELMLPLFYVSNYAKALFGTPDVMQHSWSLSVETQFYLTWPLFLLATLRMSPHALARLLFAMFAIAVAWRALNIHLMDSWYTVYYRADTRLPGLILGAFLAVTKDRIRLPEQAGILALAALIACVLCGRWETPLSLSLGSLIVELATFVLVAAVVSGQSAISRLLSWGPLPMLGVLSYSIYLWHYPVARVLRDYDMPRGAVVLAVLAISIALAALTYFAVERPVSRMAKLRKSSRQAVSAP